jgi:hypothetical protein
MEGGVPSGGTYKISIRDPQRSTPLSSRERSRTSKSSSSNAQAAVKVEDLHSWDDRPAIASISASSLRPEAADRFCRCY